MRQYVKKLGNCMYLYADDDIYICHGKILRKQKSMGRYSDLADFGNKIADFQKYIISLEADLRTIYFKPLIVNKSFPVHLKIGKLEFLRSFLFREKQKLGKTGELMLDRAFATDFIYNSNKIEGSKLPKSEVEKLVKSPIKGINEVSNTLRAIKLINSIKFGKMTVLNIKKIHSVLLADEHKNHGFRKEPIVVGNCTTIDHREARSELLKLITWLKKNMHKMYPLELAFTFHYRFERIHPFKDGNGRIGRLLMNRILKEHRYHSIIIWSNNRDAYFSAFQKAMDGNLKPFFRFMIDQYVRSYEIYISKVKKALSLESQIKDFLSPSHD